jgi:hypothetical protein
MAIVFNVLLHILLVGAMGAFAITLFVTAFRAPTLAERLRRYLGLFLGAMIVVGAQAGGVSFAVFTAGALASGRGPSAAAGLIASVIPALTGLGLGFYMVHVYRQSEKLGLRLLCFLGMLALVAFIEVYAVATHTNGVFLGVSAVPNVAFAAGVGLVLIFGNESNGKVSLLDRGVNAWHRLRGQPNTERVKPAANGSGVNSAAGRAHDPFDI